VLAPTREIGQLYVLFVHKILLDLDRVSCFLIAIFDLVLHGFESVFGEAELLELAVHFW